MNNYYGDKYYRPVLNEGTHLAASKNTVGRVRGSLLNNETNQLCGQAEFEEVAMKKEFSPETEVLFDILIKPAVDRIFDVAEYYVMQWIDNTAIPAIKRGSIKVKEKVVSKINRTMFSNDKVKSDKSKPIIKKQESFETIYSIIIPVPCKNTTSTIFNLQNE